MSRSVVWVGLLAFAARAALMRFEPGLTYDGTYYLRQVARLASGDYQWVGFPPGYPLAVLGVKMLVPDPELAARVVSLLAGVASVIVFHVWARRILSPHLATVGALLLAVHPDLLRANVQVLSESLFVLLVLLGVMWSERRVAWSSLMLGLAFLCRPEALLVLVGLPVVLAWRDRKLPSAAWLLGVLVVAGYAVLASRAVGDVVISPKQGQLDLGADVFARTWTLIRMTHAVFPLVLLPGALWVGALSRRAWLVPCAYLVLLPFYDIHIQQRMLLPALPFLILLSGLWLQRLMAAPRRVALLAAAVLLVVGTYPTARTLGTPGVITPRARDIGAALAPHLDFEDRVAGRFPFVSYYAGAGFVRLPLAAYPTIMDSIVTWGATHLLVLESEMRNITPHLRPLMEDAVFTAAEGRLQAVAWVDDPLGHRAILYRMREPDVSRAHTPVVRRGAHDVDWLGDDLVVASGRGIELLPVAAGAPLPDTTQVQTLTREPTRDLAASADGRRLVFVSANARLAIYDHSTQETVTFASTARDQPVSPTFVGDDVVYVRSTRPPGLRVLDTSRDATRAVVLEGLSSTDATPLAVTARERDLAITFARTGERDPLQRVIATATWPTPMPATGAIELPGKWATGLPLADDHVAWLPGQQRVLASIAIRELDENGLEVRLMTSLAVVHSSAVYRRMSFDIDRVRRPARRDSRLALVSGDGDVRVGWLRPDSARIPRTRVFASVAP